MCNTLLIDPEFESLCPAITPEEFSLLDASIDNEGCREPILLWSGDGNPIIDGHNRYRICSQVGHKFKTKILDLPDRQACIEWIISNQLGRRNCSEEQKAYLRGKRYKHEKKKQGGTGANQHKEQSGNSCHSAKTEEKLAAEYSVSPKTIRNDAAFAESVDAIAEVAPEVKQEILSGRSELTRKQIQEVAEAPPERRVEAIQEIKKVHVSNNSGVVEWYTPPIYIDAAREVMGEIDLDPATSEVAQENVKASCYYTAADGGLEQQWSGRVWMNPPYAAGLVDDFIEKLCEHYVSEEVTEAVVLVNNATETKWFQRALRTASAACFPASRIKYLNADGVPANSPLQGQAFLYLGVKADRFREVFSEFGTCVEVRT
jgi:phage N-6-adenine-methyltransferase